jgi:hypothetical protein
MPLCANLARGLWPAASRLFFQHFVESHQTEYGRQRAGEEESGPQSARLIPRHNGVNDDNGGGQHQAYPPASTLPFAHQLELVIRNRRDRQWRRAFAIPAKLLRACQRYLPKKTQFTRVP